MEENLKIAVIQSDLVWEDAKANRVQFTKKIHAITEEVDLIVLPEMFTTGFTMQPERVAETMQGDSVKWMQETAKSSKAALVGSIVIKEDKKFYNRLLFVHPDGKTELYDKRHTFTLAGEDRVYQAGNKKIIVAYKGWKICPLVCYDLRFPVWARNTEDYDMLIYIASWPKIRTTAWDALLKARAIENMAYCVGVNRVGYDVNDYAYSGSSAVYDVLGEKITNIALGKEQTEVVILSKSHIKKYRERLHFLGDRDAFSLKV